VKQRILLMAPCLRITLFVSHVYRSADCAAWCGSPLNGNIGDLVYNLFLPQRYLLRKESDMADKLTIESKLRLNDGHEMPWFGFGTWQLATGEKGLDALCTALNTNYRMIDTARAYDNESLVGESVRQCGVPRDQIFIPSKLWNTDHGFKPAKYACQNSLRALTVDYVDLYLIHWPGAGKNEETWQALIELQQARKCRSIGVSNFGIDDLQKLMRTTGLKPAVNQIEYNVFTYPRELEAFCKENSIAVEAYSPLARGQGLSNAIVNEIAKAYDKKPSQVMLRWVLQHDAITIPKSSTPEHIRENADIFDFSLSEEDMHRLDGISG
jgi:methylglyoxal/glyoxal reductase